MTSDEPVMTLSGSTRIDHFMRSSRPHSPAAHLFDGNRGSYIFLSNGSRLYEIDPSIRSELETAPAGPEDELLRRSGLGAIRELEMSPVSDPPLHSLSLAVTQACNMSCGYCYAQGGSFGRPEKLMPWHVAEAAVRKLFEGKGAGDRVVLAFLGGEPLINRSVIRRATALASELAYQQRARVGFSITTNGTLVTPEDGAFFDEHGYSVTVSLDGIGPVHDQLRPLASKKGSYDRIIGNVAHLLKMQHRMQVSARVTVTPANINLLEILDRFINMGFHSVGFSPLVTSPTGLHQLETDHFKRLLGEMMLCGDECQRHIIRGERYPFSNLTTALMHIHRGTHRPYPCGAGASYLSVSASGEFSPCHRFVEDEQHSMGSLQQGIVRELQNSWLRDRNVDHQEPCASCWARYLCGGGCHHEVIHRGRVACDYIRGWLQYCLIAYVHLLNDCPEFFSRLSPCSMFA